MLWIQIIQQLFNISAPQNAGEQKIGIKQATFPKHNLNNGATCRVTECTNSIEPGLINDMRQHIHTSIAMN